MKGMWVGYDIGCTMGLTCGHGAWQIDRQSSGSMWNSYSFQPVGQWISYSFTDLGAEGCCRSLNALLWFVFFSIFPLTPCTQNNIFVGDLRRSWRWHQSNGWYQLLTDRHGLDIGPTMLRRIDVSSMSISWSLISHIALMSHERRGQSNRRQLEVSTFPIVIIFFRGCVPEMFVTSYSVTYCIYIPGKPGISFHYYCAVYDACK